MIKKDKVKTWLSLGPILELVFGATPDSPLISGATTLSDYP